MNIHISCSGELGYATMARNITKTGENKYKMIHDIKNRCSNIYVKIVVRTLMETGCYNISVK